MFIVGPGPRPPPPPSSLSTISGLKDQTTSAEQSPPQQGHTGPFNPAPSQLTTATPFDPSDDGPPPGPPLPPPPPRDPFGGGGFNHKGRPIPRDNFLLRQKLKAALAMLDFEKKTPMGTQLEDFIIDCEYSGYSCNLTYVINSSYL